MTAIWFIWFLRPVSCVSFDKREEHNSSTRQIDHFSIPLPPSDGPFTRKRVAYPLYFPTTVNIALKESAHDQNDQGNEDLRDVYGRPWIMPGPIISGMTPSALADSFNAKPSAWGMTLTAPTADMLTPPDVLAKMPPKQRAKLEQSIQAGSGKTTTHVSVECVTLSDLDQNCMIKEEDGLRCITKVVSKFSSKLVIERTCPAPCTSTSQMAIEAKTPEHIADSIDMTRAGSGKVHVAIKGRWLRTSCAEINDHN